MNEEIHKAIMIMSRLRNKFLKEKTAFSREAYNRTKKLLRKINKRKQKLILGNLNVKSITDNKIF